jgi:hypothetical protein
MTLDEIIAISKALLNRARMREGILSLGLAPSLAAYESVEL